MEHGLNAIFGCVVSVGLCLLLSVVYLASLHVWNSPFSRDHPTTIKKRFVSVFFMLFVAPCFLYIGLDKNTLQKVSFLEVLGVKSKGLWQALIVPLLLTVVLFLGPISMEVSNSLGKLYAGKSRRMKMSISTDDGPVSGEGAWHANFTNLIWIRNHLVAPFSEEFTYRSCMLPLLLQCFPATTAIAVNPLLFGIGAGPVRDGPQHGSENIMFSVRLYDDFRRILGLLVVPHRSFCVDFRRPRIL
ncbi:CAAX prenyl protease 2 isoform X4 [Cylas formicarius]|uniref:CAAX prenyl protease 2 isoform X4 n=1 Tax=Cylas formicarius TaxID=197179 RepID=UPI002958C3F0|nr:CAAX prenyl protease 2 isoform X4 [Cylas formicarius]